MVGIIALVPDLKMDSLYLMPRQQVLIRLAATYRVEVVAPRSAEEAPVLAWIARRKLQARGCDKIVLYIWRPSFRWAMHVPHDVSIYHIDDEYSWSTIDVPTCRQEQWLLKKADYVITASRELQRKKGGVYVPNGVDYEMFSAIQPEPADLASIPHPRIGYTGYLKPQLDWSLLNSLTRENKKWQFVFVGPVHPAIKKDLDYKEVLKRANCHFLGPRVTAQMAAYPQHFDVCIMPYAINDYTRYICPLKMYEYLAAGKPTVSSDIPGVYEASPCIAVADGDWNTKINRAIQSPTDPQKLQAMARANDWSYAVKEISNLIEQ